MSGRSYRPVDAAAAVLAAIVCLSTMARAADPNVPAAEKPRTQKTTQPPASKPQTPPKPAPAPLFTPEMSFGKAMDILRKSTTPPLNLVVLWREIGENAGLYSETPVGVTLPAGLRVGQYLELLLLSLSSSAPAKLGYTVNDGVITVGTTGSLRAPKRVTRIYDISDLVAEPARYFFPPMGFGGMGYNGSMMGPAGGYGGGGGPGTYGPAAVRGLSPDQGLSNALGNLYGGAQRPSQRRR